MCLLTPFFVTSQMNGFILCNKTLLHSLTKTAKLLHVNANDFILLERVFILLLLSLVWQRLADS